MKIFYANNEIEVEENKSIYELLKENINKKTIAARVNNEVKSLDFIPNENSNIELIGLENKDGRRIYIRGLLYVMDKAIKELYPEALITINYQLSNSMLCEIDNIQVTEEMVININNKIQEIIAKDLPITKVEMTQEEANKFYEENHTLNGKLQLDIKENIILYYCENYFNYFYGVMPISTGYMTIYELLRYDNNSFLIRYPSKEEADKLPEKKDNKKLLATLREYDDLHKDLNINTIYKLNKVIEEGRIKEAIALDEALHEKKIAGIADEIAKRKNVKMVLIAGPSSSGKTTFAQKLKMQLKINGLKPVTISVDNYFVEREQNPIDENGKYDFECIEAIDLKLFNEHIVKLLNGEEIQVPTFDFTKGSKIFNGNTMKLEDNEILIIEGIHCLNDKLTEQIPSEQKYKIYISALTVLNIDYYNRISTTDTRLIRRIVRDYQFRGYTALHTLGMWDSVNRGEEKNIFPFQEEADSMFNSSLIYELAVLKDFAMPLLKEITNQYPEFSEAKRIYKFLSYFKSIPAEYVPINSLLREFIGGSTFSV